VLILFIEHEFYFNLLLNIKILESMQERCHHISSTHHHTGRSLDFVCHPCVAHHTDEPALQEGFLRIDVSGSFALALSSSIETVRGQLGRRHGSSVHMSDSIWDAAAFRCISHLR